MFAIEYPSPCGISAVQSRPRPPYGAAHMSPHAGTREECSRTFPRRSRLQAFAEIFDRTRTAVS